MSKLKIKITVFVFLSILGLVVGFFFSGLVHLALSGDFKNAGQLQPTAIFHSIATDEKHRIVFLDLEVLILACISVVMLMNKRDTFESDTSKVTQTIQTPIAIGQGQHGTARWLRKDEQRKTFSFYRLDSHDSIIKSLTETGEKDRKGVKEYANKQIESTIANGDTETNNCTVETTAEK